MDEFQPVGCDLCRRRLELDVCYHGVGQEGRTPRLEPVRDRDDESIILIVPRPQDRLHRRQLGEDVQDPVHKPPELDGAVLR